MGTRDLALTLAEGGSIAGTLTSRSAPVERFTVTVRETKTSFSRDELFFHAQGAFALHDLPPGTYEVEAETPHGTATAEVTLAEGEQKTGVALTLTLRGAIDGRLVELESGAPIAGARLGVDGSGSASLVNGDNKDNATGADGHFHLDGVLAGKWSLSVSTQDSSVDYARVPIVVQEGGGTSDLGAIRIPRRRLLPGEQRGDLGFYVDQGESPGEVKVVSGAAEEAGIQVGDVVASIDGFDVRGSNQYLFPTLTTVAAGRTVSVGLARGTCGERRGARGRRHALRRGHPPSRIWRATARSSTSIGVGLLSHPTAPIAAACWASLVSPESTSTGTAHSAGARSIRALSSAPLISGIIRSSRIRSGAPCSSSHASASAPPAAQATS